METSIRIVDYHLKERIEGQNSKIMLSGRSPRRKVERLSYHIALFMSYERLIELELLNFTRIVYPKKRVTRLALFQR